MLERIKNGYIKVMRYIIGVKINVIEDNNIKVDDTTREKPYLETDKVVMRLIENFICRG